MEGVEEVIYPRQRVSILDSSRVKLAEVHAKAQTTVFFSYHHYWGSPWVVRGADDVAGQHLLNLRHLLPSNCGVLPAIGLVERGPIGLYRMLQQRSTPEVIFSFAKHVVKLAK